MRRSLTVAAFAACLLLITQAAGQTPAGVSPPVVPAAIQAAIQNAEQRWATALVAQDAAQLEATLYKQFALTNSLPGGEERSVRSIDRDSYLQLTAMRRYLAMTPVVTKIEYKESDSANLAIAYVDLTVGWSALDSNDQPSQWRFIDLWTLEDGRWQVITRIGQPR